MLREQSEEPGLNLAPAKKSCCSGEHIDWGCDLHVLPASLHQIRHQRCDPGWANFDILVEMAIHNLGKNNQKRGCYSGRDLSKETNSLGNKDCFAPTLRLQHGLVAPRFYSLAPNVQAWRDSYPMISSLRFAHLN
jgi:hypothetical protein